MRDDCSLTHAPRTGRARGRAGAGKRSEPVSRHLENIRDGHESRADPGTASAPVAHTKRLDRQRAVLADLPLPRKHDSVACVRGAGGLQAIVAVAQGFPWCEPIARALMAVVARIRVKLQRCVDNDVVWARATRASHRLPTTNFTCHPDCVSTDQTFQDRRRAALLAARCKRREVQRRDIESGPSEGARLWEIPLPTYGPEVVGDRVDQVSVIARQWTKRAVPCVS